MQFLGLDHLSGILLEHYRAALHDGQKFPVEGEGLRFGLERFSQDGADVCPMRVEQRSDRERRILAKMGDHLSGLLRMGKRLRGLLAQPGDDGNAIEAEYQ